MIIRQANLEDADALSYLLAKVWKATYQEIFPNSFLDNLRNDGWSEGFRQSLKNDQTHIFVAELKNEIIAMIAFGEGRDSKITKQFNAPHEIYALNVLPDFQKQHIGSQLLQLALKQFHHQGIYLKVACKNNSAQSFYLKYGFRNSQIQQTRQIEDFTFQEWIFIY